MAQRTTFDVTGQKTEQVQLTISALQLRWAIYAVVYDKIGTFDDAGCDWFTDNAGRTYVAHRDWLVSSDTDVATLVDAAAIIAYGKRMDIADAPDPD